MGDRCNELWQGLHASVVAQGNLVLGTMDASIGRGRFSEIRRLHGNPLVDQDHILRHLLGP